MKQKYFLFMFMTFIVLSLHINEGIYATSKKIELRLEMRKLWEDSIEYTRNFIISAIAQLGDQGTVTLRLIKSQDDIGDSIKPYFGDKIGHEFAELLREHIVLAETVVTDAIEGNIQKFNQDYDLWQKNAKKIAEFLHKHNSHWSRKEIKKMLYKHLALTIGEATSRLNQDWAADIESYDKNHSRTLIFADVLTKGIIKKFPHKFK